MIRGRRHKRDASFAKWLIVPDCAIKNLGMENRQNVSVIVIATNILDELSVVGLLVVTARRFAWIANTLPMP